MLRNKNLVQHYGAIIMDVGSIVKARRRTLPSFGYRFLTPFECGIIETETTMPNHIPGAEPFYFPDHHIGYLRSPSKGDDTIHTHSPKYFYARPLAHRLQFIETLIPVELNKTPT